MAGPFQEWSPEQKAEIIKKLREKNVRAGCPMCGTNNFVLLDGFFLNSIQPNIGGGMVLGGPAVPTIAIACANCGFISQHAAGALGLMPAATEEAKK